MFLIQSITAQASNYLGDHLWVVEVSVLVDAKAWAKMRDKGQLGSLYGVDISNAVYAINQAIPASRPTVGDSERASKGFKRISLTYSLTDAAQAEALGLKVHRYRNGEVAHVYGDRVSIPVPRQKPDLKVI